MDIMLNKEVNMIRNSTMFKGCVHNDSECNGTTSKAHSIQNNRYLDKLADDGDVLCIDFGKVALNRKLQLHNVGRHKASIFTGLCNHHDSSIFKPIEEFDFQRNNKEQNFLFAYRAFALSYYERHSSYGFMKENLEIKKKKNALDIEEYEEQVAFYKEHLEYIEKLRVSMNINLDNKNYHRISTEILEWSGNYGLAATSMFFINKDKEGRVVNSPLSFLSPFFFTILPANDRTFVIMSHLTKDSSRYSFIKRQIVNTEIDEQKMLISNILAMNVENFFISPSRWKALSQENRGLFLNILEKTKGREKPGLGYFNKLNLFS